MIVTRMTFEFPNAAWNTANRQDHGAGKLFNRIAGTPLKDATQTGIEEMSLSELLYFALVDQNAIA